MAGGLGNKCVSDAAYIQAASDQAGAIRRQATVDAAIASSLALYQRNSSRDITNMQNEIASAQVALAEATQQHAEQFWPEELELIQDVFGEGKATPDYASLPQQWKQIVSSSMENGRLAWINEANRYCRPATLCADARWQRGNMIAQADIMSFAARQAEGRADVINDRRYEQRYAVLQLGRGQLGTILGYQAVGLTAGGSAAGFLAGSINSALEAYGYYTDRQQAPQWGHAAGIRSKWGVPYTPQAVAQAAPVMAPAQTSAILPTAQVTTQQLPSGKETEMDEGLEIYQRAREDGYFN